VISDPVIGERFGRLTVTAVGMRLGRIRAAAVQCDCGAERVVPVYPLRSGARSSCGCSRPSLGTPEELTGRRFGMLTVGRVYRDGRYLRADVLCDCGGAKQGVYVHNLKAMSSCGHACSERRAASPIVGRRYGRFVVTARLPGAADTSRLFPSLDVAVCTPGDARGLRRFRAGLPLDPPRSPR